MAYIYESMRWWKVVYALLHGKALRLMSGMKHEGVRIERNDQEEEDSGTLDPTDAVIKLRCAVHKGDSQLQNIRRNTKDYEVRFV